MGGREIEGEGRGPGERRMGGVEMKIESVQRGEKDIGR